MLRAERSGNLVFGVATECFRVTDACVFVKISCFKPSTRDTYLPTWRLGHDVGPSQVGFVLFFITGPKRLKEIQKDSDTKMGLCSHKPKGELRPEEAERGNEGTDETKSDIVDKILEM